MLSEKVLSWKSYKLILDWYPIMLQIRKKVIKMLGHTIQSISPEHFYRAFIFSTLSSFLCSNFSSFPLDTHKHLPKHLHLHELTNTHSYYTLPGLVCACPLFWISHFSSREPKFGPPECTLSQAGARFCNSSS